MTKRQLHSVRKKIVMRASGLRLGKEQAGTFLDLFRLQTQLATRCVDVVTLLPPQGRRNPMRA
jgi:hypothetical protein